MPSHRPASSPVAAERARRAGATDTARRPSTVRTRLPNSRIRWDRKLRLTMLVVLALVGWVGLHAFLAMMRTRAQSSHELSLVSALTRENRSLAQQALALQQPATIVRAARALGMVRTGERSYVITGLPSR
jgi:cell division protein FtsB